jgi:hypothetical protein
MTTSKDQDLVAAIRRMAVADALEETRDMSDAEVAASMREEGGDPASVVERGRALADKLAVDRKRLAWRDAASARLERGWATLRTVTSARSAGSLPSRAELERRLEAAKNDPRLAAPLAAAARKRKPEDASDEELAWLLDEAEAIARMDHREDEDEK